MIVAGHLLGNYTSAMPSLDELPLHIDQDPDQLDADQSVWRCRMCGYVHYGKEAPDECPYCFFPKESFKKMEH